MGVVVTRQPLDAAIAAERVQDICFLFPGQTSWRARMLRDAADLCLRSGALLEQASQALGRDLLAIDAQEAPARNRDVQVGVLLASLLQLTALESAGVRASSSLGLSLGEYAHLVHIGALAPLDALRLVDQRGALYEAGPVGKMAAVFPLPHEELQRVLARLAEPVEIVNLNSPTQNVIAGAPAAVDSAIEALENEHFVHAVVIDSRIAMHSSGFAGVGSKFRARLAVAPWRAPQLAYRPNVTAEVMLAPSAEDLVEHLVRHVSEPVLWRASVEQRARESDDVLFVEVGPGSVLTNLLSRKWLPGRKLAIDATKQPGAAIDALVTELNG